jgi:hypothetical protein
MLTLVNLNAPNNPNEFSGNKFLLIRPEYIREQAWSRYNSENASCNGVHHYVSSHFQSKHLSIKTNQIYSFNCFLPTSLILKKLKYAYERSPRCLCVCKSRTNPH